MKHTSSHNGTPAERETSRLYVTGGRLSAHSRALFGSVLSLAVLLSAQNLSAAGPAPLNLRSAAHFTILAGAAVTTTGGGTIDGDVGTSPITGAAIHLTQAQVKGTIYSVDAAGPAGAVIDPALLLVAKGDLTTAYNDAAGRVPIPSGPFLNPGAGNIGGMNLVPGLYKFTSTALITGSDLTLTGGPDDVWIFQIGADLQVGSGRHVILAGGARARNIFWQVGTSAVIDTFAVFKGTILADQAITMNTSSTMEGRALATAAGVTYNGTGGSLPAVDLPVFTDIRVDERDVTVVLKTTPYYPLTLQTNTELGTDNWISLITVIPSSSKWTYTHTNALPEGTKRFYRAYISY